MELKSYALQWLKNHDMYGEEESPQRERSICVVELFDTIEDQEQSGEALKHTLATFASIVASFYSSGNEDEM